MAANAFSFAGQSCISVQRIYVERPAYDRFVAASSRRCEALKVGDPADEETDVGPVIDEARRDRILAWIDEAGGAPRSWPAATRQDGLIRPTVIANAAPERKVSCEEVFGPVVTVNAVDSLDEAIELANATRYGLQAGIFTRLDSRAARGAAARVRRRDRQRGADLPRRSDAVRRGQGLGQHARGPGLRGARADRGAARRARPLVIGVAIALMVIGLVFGFVIPWVAIVVGLVGALLFVASSPASAAAPRRTRASGGAARLAPLMVLFSLLTQAAGRAAAPEPQPFFRRALAGRAAARAARDRRRPARSGSATSAG